MPNVLRAAIERLAERCEVRTRCLEADRLLSAIARPHGHGFALLTQNKGRQAYHVQMNAISTIEPSIPRAQFEAARDAAATWRGRCLEVFARSEAAVTETLLILAQVDKRGASLKLPHLVGQRYDALSNAIGPDGAFADEGKAVVEPLSKFRSHDSLRTQISHGVFTVTLDHRGQWHLASRVLALRTGRANRDLFVTDQAGSDELLKSLEKDGGRLRSALGQLRRRFRSV